VNPFGVTRNGIGIDAHPIRNKGKNPNISYKMPFLEWQAGVAANLDMWQWEQNIYPNWFKARTIEWYLGHEMVEAHTKDANIVKPKK